MRTAHIIEIKGDETQIVATGLYSEMRAKFEKTNPSAGVKLELWAKDFKTKFKKGAPLPVKKK